MKTRQLQLFGAPILEHGGDIRKGKRKAQRPFDRNRPLHLVLRSSRAKKEWSFLHERNKGFIHLTLVELSEQYEIKIYGYENVGNHLHILAQFPARQHMQNFLRAFTKEITQFVTGARKGDPKGKFFDRTTYSKVVSWGREFQRTRDYLWKNMLESLGFTSAEIARIRALQKEVPIWDDAVSARRPTEEESFS